MAGEAGKYYKIVEGPDDSSDRPGEVFLTDIAVTRILADARVQAGQIEVIANIRTDADTEPSTKEGVTRKVRIPIPPQAPGVGLQLKRNSFLADASAQ